MKTSAIAGLLLMGLLNFLPAGTASAQGADERGRPRLDVPYVPTDPEVVQAMLRLAELKPGDRLYDLGCGDGRIVIEAARSQGARGTGIDLDPERIAEARNNAKEAGVQDRVNFLQTDLLKADFSDADVVSLYLLPSVNLKLRPQLWKQLRPGTRIVSHDFDMGPDWPPEKTVHVSGSTVYRWTITDRHKQLVRRQ